MKSDIEIARDASILPIGAVAERFGIDAACLEPYGRYKAKFSEDIYASLKNRPDGRLVLVTAINPTPAGEGKTTTTIGLAQALNRLGHKTIAALREPSLGPCMGLKGGAAGGGYAQVLPMDEINLHFTGDIHAVTTANNLLAAMIDNHIHQGNILGIDPRRITWKRALDINDRALREIVAGLGGKANGVPREDGFQISVASEVMAILCLAGDLAELRQMLAAITVGYTWAGKPVSAGDLKAEGAMCALLKDALKPNLVQTLEGTPTIIHGGPFANIAHGCNSVRATRLALKLADITVTEAGFGADLGAEKFFDIKCRKAGLRPDAAVLVATVRALKYNGGAAVSNLAAPDMVALERGFPNMEKHIANLQRFGVSVIVALNRFGTDAPEEIDWLRERCRKLGADFALSEVFARGGEGGQALAERLMAVLDSGQSDFRPLYPDDMGIGEKIGAICRKIYGAGSVAFSKAATAEIGRIRRRGLGHLPVCIAKTQYSLSDDPALLGRPEGFEVNVREVRLSSGAGFVVALLGDVMTMPGLPKNPAAENIDVDAEGYVTGLF